MSSWLETEKKESSLTFCDIISGFLKFTKRYKDLSQEELLIHRKKLEKYYWDNIEFDDAYMYEYKNMREMVLLFFEQDHFSNYFYRFIDAWQKKFITPPTVDEIANNFPVWIQSHIEERYKHVKKAQHLSFPVLIDKQKLTTTMSFPCNDIRILSRLLKTLEMKEGGQRNRDISKETYPDKEYDENTRRLVQRDYKLAVGIVRYIEDEGFFFLEETP